MSLWVTVIVRLATAGAAVFGLEAWIDGLPAPPSIWVLAMASFGLVKLIGDIVGATFFRRSLVFFYEDLFWELVAFLILGLLAGGLILLVENFVGGPIRPYIPALGVYLVYLLAEGRQYRNGEGG